MLSMETITEPVSGEIPVMEYNLPDSVLINSAERSGSIIWRPDRLYVVLGRANNAKDSLVYKNIIADNVPVYKRPSGGESVILSPGMIVFSLKTGFTGTMSTSQIFSKINRSLIGRLSELGIRNLHSRGISDLSIGEKKIAGSSMYLIKDSLFYHSVLNLSEDVSLISKYLRHPKREPDYRLGRSHDEFVTSIRREGYVIGYEQIEEKIALALKELED